MAWVGNRTRELLAGRNAHHADENLFPLVLIDQRANLTFNFSTKFV